MRGAIEGRKMVGTGVFDFLVGVLSAVFVGIAEIGARRGVESLRTLTPIVARQGRKNGVSTPSDGD